MSSVSLTGDNVVGSSWPAAGYTCGLLLTVQSGHQHFSTVLVAYEPELTTAASKVHQCAARHVTLAASHASHLLGHADGSDDLGGILQRQIYSAQFAFRIPHS